MVDPASIERVDDSCASLEVDRIGKFRIGLGDWVTDQPGQERNFGDAVEGALERFGVPQVSKDE